MTEDHLARSIEAYREKRLQVGDHEAALHWTTTRHIFTHPITDKIYLYDGYYKDTGETIIKRALVETYPDVMTRNRISEVLNRIRALTKTTLDNLNPPPNLLPFQLNKENTNSTYIYDLNKKPITYEEVTSLDEENGTQTIHYDPEAQNDKGQHLFTYHHPVVYNPRARCPNIDAFLSSVVKPEDKNLLIDIAALCLYRKRVTRKFFILVGEGHNGKSVYLTILRSLIGEDRCVSITPQGLTERQFTPVLLHDKHANLGADIPGGYIKDASMIKSVTGGDMITVEKKGKDHFEAKPYCELIYSSNNPPRFQEDTTALWDRIVIINFPYIFTRNPVNPNEKKEIHDIVERCTTPDELSGFLNLALDALHRIIDTGRLSVEYSTEETRDQYTTITDTPVYFLQDMCEEVVYEPGFMGADSKGWVGKSELYSEYRRWCSSKGLKLESQNTFGKRVLAAPGWSLEESKDSFHGEDRVNSYRGIRVKKQSGVSGMSGLNSFSGLNFKEIEDRIEKKPGHPGQPGHQNTPNKTAFDLGIHWLRNEFAKNGPVPYATIQREYPALIAHLPDLVREGVLFNPRPDQYGVLE